jgi:Rrf2 family cysteine metabolism transcriptional repressor
MRVSTRTTYGIRALVELAIRHTEEPVSVKFLAQRLGVSKYYLENLMLILKRNGFVAPSRGPKGGYSLARHPADISLPEVFIALEGSETLAYCGTCPDSCPHSNYCASRDLFKLLCGAMVGALSSITLKTMAEWQVLKLKRSLLPHSHQHLVEEANYV